MAPVNPLTTSLLCMFYYDFLVDVMRRNLHNMRHVTTVNVSLRRCMNRLDIYILQEVAERVNVYCYEEGSQRGS